MVYWAARGGDNPLNPSVASRIYRDRQADKASPRPFTRVLFDYILKLIANTHPSHTSTEQWSNHVWNEMRVWHNAGDSQVNYVQIKWTRRVYRFQCTKWHSVIIQKGFLYHFGTSSQIPTQYSNPKQSINNWILLPSSLNLFCSFVQLCRSDL